MKLQIRFLILALSVVCINIGNAQTPTVTPSLWSKQSIYSDEFNGTILSNSLWYDYDPNSDGCKNYTVPRNWNGLGLTDNLSLAPASVGTGTVLKITTRKENSSFQGICDYDSTVSVGYTAGMIKSINQFQYGYYEIRAKLPPAGPSIGSSFWLWGESQDSYREIDIFEMSSKIPSIYPMNIHYSYRLNSIYDYNSFEVGYQGAPNDLNDPYKIPPVYNQRENFSDGFHVFGLDWQPDKVDFYIDDKLVYHTTQINRHPFLDNSFAPNQPVNVLGGMHLVLNAGIGPLTDNLPTKPGDFEVDYFRLYKRNPQITPDASNDCSAGTLKYTASTGIAGDSYQWTVDPNQVTVIGGTTSSTIELKLKPGYTNQDVNISVTATQIIDQDTVPPPTILSSTATYTIPRFDPEFKVSSPNCGATIIGYNTVLTWVTSYFVLPGGIKIPIITLERIQTPIYSYNLEFTVEATGNNPGAIDKWTLHISGTADNPNIPPIQTGYGKTFTFNSNLISGQTYTVKHGVYGNCIAWAEKRQDVKIDLSDFDYTVPFCDYSAINNNNINTNQMYFSVSAKSSGLSGSDWRLYDSDAQGRMLNTTPIYTYYGNSATFKNLIPNHYYIVNHGVYGNCSPQWIATDKVIHVKDMGEVSADFTVTPGSISSSQRTVSVEANPVAFPYSSGWYLFNSNANGDQGSQIGNVSYGNSYSYNLPSQNYYLIAHGVYNGCNSWRARSYLVKDNIVKAMRVSQDSLKRSNNLSPNVDEIPITVFPNPAKGTFTVNSSYIFDTQVDFNISLTNILGERIYDFKQNSKMLNASINLPELPQGVYVLKVSYFDRFQIYKLIVD